MASISANTLNGLARSLMQEKLLSEEDALSVQAQAEKSNNLFITQLIKSQKLLAPQIAEFASHSFGFPYFNLDALNVDYIPEQIIDVRSMQTHRLIPLQKKGNTLFVGISDPTNLHGLDEVQFQVGMSLSPLIVEDDKLGTWIFKLIEASGANIANMVGGEELDLSVDNEKNKDKDNNAPIDVDDAPIVKYINKILLDAINMGASDLHFEPYEKFYRIRYRVDGILRDIAQPPLSH